MTEREALKLALGALKANDLLINGTEKAGGLAWCIDGYYSGCFDINPINEQTERAITAIKEALAQPPEEPIKWSSYEPDGTYHNKSAHQQEVADEYGVCSGCGMKYCECGEQDD